MDVSLYLSKEYNISNMIWDRDLHYLKLIMDSDKRKRQEEEKIRKDREKAQKFKIK